MSTTRSRMALSFIMAGACGNVASRPEGVDASTARCSPAAPFGTPRLVPGAGLNTTANEFNPRLTLDELGLYFARSPGMVGGWDIYVATRTDVGGDFGTPTVVRGIDGAASSEFDGSVTADGLTMYLDAFSGGPASFSDSDVFVSTRTSTATDFSTPVPVSAVNTTAFERGAYIIPSGRALYFSRYSLTDASDEKIYRATIGPTGVGVPVEVTWPGTVSPHGLPVVTPDERTLYFSASSSTSNIWMATRTSAADPFGMPTPVSELNRSGSFGADLSWVSADGCVLYFSDSGGGTGQDLYFAQRGN